MLGGFVDNGDGSYDVTYNLTTRGQWLLHVKTGGVHIAGSPFTVSALPGATDPASSFATGPGLSKVRVRVNVRVRVRVHLRLLVRVRARVRIRVRSPVLHPVDARVVLGDPGWGWGQG